ncbi:MAG: CinA family protein [Desulfovibrionaceae bacterium]|nr:CinA family protein [Desulfovibrionaceae bacterium]
MSEQNILYYEHSFSLLSELAYRLTASGMNAATAESCTGGLVSALFTSIPGSSEWFRGGVVAYDNAVKQNLLGVPLSLLEQFGAVSEETAKAMAAGARKLLGVECALAVTGIAGPGGGSPEKKVGTVCFAWDIKGNVSSITRRLNGSRREVRMAAVDVAVRGLLERLV